MWREKPEFDDLIVEIGGEKKSTDFELAADLAEQLIPGVDLKAELGKLAKEKSYKVSAERGQYRYYVREKRVTFEPTPTCLQAIRSLKETEGSIDGRVFAIPSVYALQNVKYEFNNSNDIGSEISASVAKVVEASLKAGYKSERTGEGTAITENEGWITLAIGKPVPIEKFDISGAVGIDQEVTLTLGEPIDFEYLEVGER